MSLPALNECIEQLTRCVLTVLLLSVMRDAPISIVAAIPCAAELCAAAVVLIIFFVRIPLPYSRTPCNQRIVKQLQSLAAPVVGGRLCTTGLRTINALLIPACLRLSGLDASAATSQYGLLTGMAMPVLMLPGIVTGALSMTSAPAVSAHENQPERLQRLILRLRRASFLIGLASSALIIALSDFISCKLYAVPALSGLLRLLSPLSLLMAMQQVQHGIIHGLGLQRRQLTGSLIGSAVTTVLIALFCTSPHLRLYGVALSMIAGQLFTYCWSCVMISRSSNTSAPKMLSLPLQE